MAPPVKIGQFIIVQPEQVQQRYVQITDGVYDLYRVLPEFIGGTDRTSGLDPATGHPHRHGIRVVVAAIGDTAFTDSVVGRSTELATPNDKGLVKHSPTLQVFDQTRNGLVDAFDQVAVGPCQKIV